MRKTQYSRCVTLKEIKAHVESGLSLFSFDLTITFFKPRPTSKSLVGVIRLPDKRRVQISVGTLDPSYAAIGFLKAVNKRFLKHSLEDLQNYVLNRSYDAPRTKDNYLESVNALISTFGITTDINDLTVACLQRFLDNGRPDKRVVKWSSDTADRHFRQLRRLFSELVAHGWIRTNPWLGVRRPRKLALPKYVPSEAEVRLILQAAREKDEQLYRMLLISSNTGARIDELLNLTDSNQNDFTSKYTVSLKFVNTASTRTKNRKDRDVWMNTTVLAAIDAQNAYKARLFSHVRSCDDNIFCNTKGRAISYRVARDKLKKCCERTGLDFHLFTWHSFRRFAARALYDLGMPIRDLMLILGHKHIITTERYLGIRQEISVKSKRALKRLGNLFSLT